MSSTLPARAFAGRILAIEFVVGASSLGTEIAAARLLAPYFGDSTLIWANTIGTVLVALSVGYWFGGRMADRDPSLRGLCRLVLLGAVLLAIVPFIAGPFLGEAVDALDAIEAGAFVGSLFAVLVLIAVPVFVLGMVSPYAVRLSVGAVEEAGTVTGRLWATSTVGSLTGTFLSALLLIPVIGTKKTFLVYALALALIAMVGLARRAVVAPVALAILLAVPTGSIKAAEAGDRLLDEAETEYGYARVIERASGDRWMELNEGQAIHSLLPADGSYLTGDYWDEALVLPYASSSGARPPERVAILGNAGGTIARAYGHFFPQARVDAVELDGELTRMGREFFDLEGENLHTHTADARPWLRRSDGDFDLIVVDTYRQPYIPFYMTTREFFALAQERLAPGGMVVVNVGHPETSDALEEALSATMGDVFATVARDAVQDTNTMLLGSDAAVSGDQLVRHLAELPPELRPLGSETAARIAPPLEGGEVYTDDIAPVEWLVDASILDVAADGDR